MSEAERIIARLLAHGSPAELESCKQSVVEALISEELLPGLAAEALLEALLSPIDAATQSEQNQRLLAAVLMQERDELTPELVESAMQALRRRKLERHNRALSHNIAEAEKKNDAAGLAALLQEKLRIERELRE